MSTFAYILKLVEDANKRLQILTLRSQFSSKDHSV